MSHIFRVFWLRENGCDAGTPLRADQLDGFFESPPFSRKILDLCADGPVDLLLHPPYLDRREWRDRREILAGLTWKRRENLISPVLAPGPALRHYTANLVLTDPVWIHAPGATGPEHVPLWQSVSCTLQRSFRSWIAEEYFSDLSRFADRETAFPMLVYQAARVFTGGTSGAFTYDLRDYPECRLTVEAATKMTGRAVQAVLASAEERLRSAGRPELAVRYAPVWYQDVSIAVRKRPRAFVALLAAETRLIDAFIELGMNKSHAGVQHFSKIASRELRKIHDIDMRSLAFRALETTSRILAAATPEFILRA